MSGSKLSMRTEELAEHTKNVALDTAFNAGKAWWDIMTGFQRDLQRASLHSFSSYSPSSETKITAHVPQQQASGVQIISVGEERLNVATRTILGETTRIRRRVVAQPVEQEVTLRDEKVIVERRAPLGAAQKPDVLTETVIEMSDSRQVPTVWKSQHVAEEIVLRKQVTERVEKVRETVRRDVVDVEHAVEAIAAPTQVRQVEKHVDILPPHAPEPERRAEGPSLVKPPLDELADKRDEAEKKAEQAEKKNIAGGMSQPQPAPRKN